VFLEQRCDRFVEHAVNANHFAQSLAIIPVRFPISLHEPHPPADAFSRFEQRNAPVHDMFDKVRSLGVDHGSGGGDVLRRRSDQRGRLNLALRLDWDAQKKLGARESTGEGVMVLLVAYGR